MATKPVVSKKELSANSTILVIVAMCLLMLIATGLVLSYVAPRIIQNTKVLVKKDAAKKAIDVKLANSKQLVGQYAQLGPKSQLVLDSIPLTPEFTQTLVILEGITNADGVKFKSATPPDTNGGAAPVGAAAMPVAAGGSYQTTGIQVTLEGPYVKILSAIKNIEKSSRPLKVISADIQGSGGIVNASLKIETYYQNAADISDGTEQVQ